MADNTFPEYPTPKLTYEEVIGYLSACRSKGWEVYKDSGRDIFIIRLPDGRKLLLDISNGVCTVNLEMIGSQWTLEKCETLAELAKTLELYGVKVNSSPPSIRLAEQEPISNFIKLSQIIGTTAEIEAVFDPYFENQALCNLLNLATLGVRISPKARFLTSTKMTSSKSPRLTKTFFEDWLRQLNSSAEIRLSSSQKPHRRFLLLSTGQVLIIGMSLNDLSKDEAAHLETSAHDLDFFETSWASASSF